tara:strand:- start:2849 stop:2953 length:105 start_codon:yes stop_codon:yes gene_type:complete
MKELKKIYFIYDADYCDDGTLVSKEGLKEFLKFE